jgi:hypothetical protein
VEILDGNGFGSVTPENRKKIGSFLEYYIAHSTIPDVAIPKHLAQSEGESGEQQRFNFTYIRALGKVLPMIEAIFGRSLDSDEVGFISEELKRYLRERGPQQA